MTTNSPRFYEAEHVNRTLENIMVDHLDQFIRFSLSISDHEHARNISRVCHCAICQHFDKTDTKVC